ncbi:MAG: ribosome maturation factor RimM [Polyangiaceae bacterium]|nr:ribosome maturation factor RimM [Polyangiaceae bacterium]
MLPPETWVPLATVARPHGVRGEVRLSLFNRDSDLLLDLDEVLVRFADGDAQEVSVDGARRTPDAILMKLHSVDDRNRAEELRGATVCARRGEFPALEPGEFYACDVEGAEVVVEDGGGGAGSGAPDSKAGVRRLGTVRALRTYPTLDVLLVDTADGGRALEVPLVDSVVRSIDLERAVVTLSSLEGVERE